MNVELKREENVLLHSKNLLTSVCVISKVYEVLHCGRVNFFVFSCNKERGDSNQLHLALLYIEEGKVPINHVDSEVESFRKELEFGVDTDEPINKDCSDIFVDVLLPFHVETIWHRFCLCCLHVKLNVRAIFADVVYIGQSCLVDLVYPRKHVLLNSVVVHLKLGMKTNFGEFLP